MHTYVMPQKCRAYTVMMIDLLCTPAYKCKRRCNFRVSFSFCKSLFLCQPSWLLPHLSSLNLFTVEQLEGLVISLTCLTCVFLQFTTRFQVSASSNSLPQVLRNLCCHLDNALSSSRGLLQKLRVLLAYLHEKRLLRFVRWFEQEQVATLWRAYLISMVCKIQWPLVMTSIFINVFRKSYFCSHPPHLFWLGDSQGMKCPFVCGVYACQ